MEAIKASNRSSRCVFGSPFLFQPATSWVLGLLVGCDVTASATLWGRHDLNGCAPLTMKTEASEIIRQMVPVLNPFYLKPQNWAAAGLRDWEWLRPSSTEQEGPEGGWEMRSTIFQARKCRWISQQLGVPVQAHTVGSLDTPSSCRTYRQLIVDGGGKTFFRASDGSEVLILPSVNLSLCKPPSWAHWSPNEQKSANTQRREEKKCGWERARGRTWRVPKYINKYTHKNIKTKPIIMYN